jgi:hypothetical protein
LVKRAPPKLGPEGGAGADGAAVGRGAAAVAVRAVWPSNAFFRPANASGWPRSWARIAEYSSTALADCPALRYVSANNSRFCSSVRVAVAVGVGAGVRVGAGVGVSVGGPEGVGVAALGVAVAASAFMGATIMLVARNNIMRISAATEKDDLRDIMSASERK